MVHAPDLFIGVQLVTLDLEHRLDAQDGGHGRPGGGDSAALLQIFQGVHGDVDAGVVALSFQDIPDLLSGLALGQQGQGVADGLHQGHGDALVVHHQHPAAVLPGQGLGRSAGAAEAGGHGEVENRIVILQKAFPQGKDVRRSRLGGGDLHPVRHFFEKEGVGDVLPLIIGLAANEKRHGDQMDAHCLRLAGRNSAVGVRHNGCFHKDSSCPLAFPPLDTQRKLFSLTIKYSIPSFP